MCIRDQLWAFYHKDEQEDGSLRKFVFINTSLPYEKQIFAAAHELAHIWGVSEDVSETLVTSADEDSPIRMDEVGSVHPSKDELIACLLYTSPSPRDGLLSRMPSSA